MHIRNGLIGGSATCRTTRVSEPPGHWGTRLGPSKGFDDWHETEYVLGCHSRWQTGSFKLDSEQCDTYPVSQLWRHTGGRSFAAAFSFKLAYGKAAYQIPEWFVLSSRKQWKKQQNVLQSKIWTHRRTLSFATGVFKYTMLTIALGKAVASLWSAGRDLQAMDVKWPAPVGNTFDKPCVWPFLESCGYWSEKWAFQQIKLDKFGTCKVLGIECGQLKNELLGASHRRSCRFLYQNDPERFFGVIWFHPACASNGPLVGYGVHLFIHFFVHEFLLSFINSSVFKSKHMCRK